MDQMISQVSDFPRHGRKVLRAITAGFAMFFIFCGVAKATPDPLPAPLPPEISRQIPPGYDVIANEAISVGPGFRIVALARTNEQAMFQKGNAPIRPLLIFARRGSGFVQVGRNDHVVLKADDGAQCDPFLDNGANIAVKGRFFTVENGVACGQHWTDYITFRFDVHAGFVFDNERGESWSMNSSTAPDGDALVRDGPQQVSRDKPGHLTPFSAWRR